MLTVQGNVSGYRYNVTSSAGSGVNVSNNRVYNMLFENTEETGRKYWLASKGIYASESSQTVTRAVGVIEGAFYGIGAVYEDYGTTYVTNNEPTFVSAGMEYSEMGMAVRPVIILKEDVTEEDINKIEDKTEENWYYDYEY